ncbi:branched-chain amino acid ABC transporter permease [Dongia sp.]|uniref:branched-chain amino acid ABC transporter permease n=1 Tax=Dongia sp. TaxID=1977262 RepID=UPI0035AE6ABE
MTAAMRGRRVLILHAGIVALLFLCQFLLPDYHHTNFVSIMVLAVYAMGYNMLVGYTGLLSLGHAMFFAAGLYGAGMGVYYLEWHPVLAFLAGSAGGLILAVAVGLIALRTTGVAFMIVTMMFAQAVFLATLYFNDITHGDEGLTLTQAARGFQLLGLTIDLTDPDLRYNLALMLFAGALLVTLVTVLSPIGRILVAIRENEERTKMLGYDVRRYKLFSLGLSGLLSGAAGAAYVLFFGYVGSSFAAISYSIYPLLWVLLGGVGTVAGPIIGTLLMFYLVEIARDHTSSYMIVVGAVLVLLVLFFPKGIAGTLRAHKAGWLP